VLTTFADDSGHFELRGVPAGPRRLAVERIGYAPREVAVNIRSSSRTDIEIELQPRAVALGGVVASATKRKLSSRDAPVSVSVMEEEEIRLRVPETIADAVAYAPSVQFVGEQVNIRGSSGYSRGTGSRVLLLMDGVPSNAGDSGGLNWDVIPLTEVSRVEIVKGAGSALYGTSALGGVINVVTADPPDRPITRIRLRAGFYDDPPHSEWIWANQTLGFGSAEASHGRRIGPLRLWLRGGLGVDDGYRENSDLDRANAALRLGIGSAADTLTLFGSWAQEKYGASILWCMRGQCPDPINRLAFQPVKVPVDAGEDRTRSDKARSYLTHRRHWSESVASLARLSLSWNDWRTDFTGGDVVAAESWVLGGELKLDWQAANWLFLTLGGEGALTDVEARGLFSAEDSAHDLTDVALYAQGELGLGPWLTLTAGLRGDIRRVDGRSVGDPEYSPRAGLVLAPDARTRLRASVGKGFRAPSAAELFTATEVGGFLVVPNPELRSERSLAGEVGIQRFFASWLSLDVAGFYYEFEDLIEADTTLATEGGITIGFENLPEAKILGAEAIARLSFFRDRLQGQAAYTYLHTETTDTTTGETLPLAYRPEHMLTASASLFLGGLELGADYRYASAFERVQVFTDERLDPRVDMRVLDARLAYRMGRQTIRFIMDNAMNYGYTTIERNLQPIRRYTVSLELEF
jgi:iron complex outermembrane receptor protein